MKILTILSMLFLVACNFSKRSKIPSPHLDSSQETIVFKDSLSRIGVDTILIYHKSHGMLPTDYFVFWIERENLELRKMNSKGIYKIASNELNGFYRDNRIFEFYSKNREQILTDTLPEPTMLHYPSSNIEIHLSGSINMFHLPYGTQNAVDNSQIHFARLIESVLFNMLSQTYWILIEKSSK